jgi:hypothetical protein
MAWPPRSLGLTPIDVFLQAHITTLIYMLPIDSEEDLIARVVEAAATMGQQPGIFEHTRQSQLHRCWVSVEVSGCTFERLL